MANELRKLISDRLSHLMRTNPALDTLEKVVEKSGVSYGTVQRIKKGDGSEPAMSKIEDVAKCFGLTLQEFISQPGVSGVELTPEEFSLIQTFRKLPDKDKSEVVFYANTRELVSSGKIKGLLSD